MFPEKPPYRTSPRCFHLYQFSTSLRFNFDAKNPKAVGNCSKPIQHAVAPMVLAFLLAPHRRCLKTIAGEVLGHRCHAATISRRLTNPQWRTRDWYVDLYDGLVGEVNAWERRQAKGKRRQWLVAIDTTCHSTMSEQMENLLVMSQRQNPARKNTRQHAFLMGLALTDRGARLPLPRKSCYTEDYCRKHKRRFRTTVELAAAMLRELRVPDDVDVILTFDSAFDAGVIHKACRKRHFHAVFPLDPNRVLARTPEQNAAWLAGEKVVAWTRQWTRKEFALLELAVDNEDHVFARRRHADNLRVKKTKRRYAVAARSDGLQAGRLPDRGVVQGEPQGATLAGPVGRVVGLSSYPGFVSPRRLPQAGAGIARCWPAPIRRRPPAKWSSGTKFAGRWNCSSGS